MDKIAQYGIKKVRIQLIDKDEMQSEWNFTKQKDIDKISRNFMDKIEVVEALISKSNDIREDFWLCLFGIAPYFCGNLNRKIMELNFKSV